MEERDDDEAASPEPWQTWLCSVSNSSHAKTRVAGARLSPAMRGCSGAAVLLCSMSATPTTFVTGNAKKLEEVKAIQRPGGTQPAYTLYYWPMPGRGVFIRSLFAYADVPYTDAPVQEIIRIKSAPFAEQPLPLRAPPFLVDHTADATISQTEGVAHYVATKLGLMPSDLLKQSLALKVLADCNDVLGEMWLHNGAVRKDGDWVLWQQPHWDEFRAGAFVDWLRMFEAIAHRFGCTAERGFLLGTPEATLADLAVWSLWATVARCVPELSRPIHEHAPTVMALCGRLEQNAGLRALKESSAQAYGSQWMGGMIEKSLREVVAGSVDGEPAA